MTSESQTDPDQTVPCFYQSSFCDPKMCFTEKQVYFLSAKTDIMTACITLKKSVLGMYTTTHLTDFLLKELNNNSFTARGDNN